MHVGLTYDIRGPRHLDVDVSRQYAACIEQCRWADAQGFSSVRLHSHHGSDDGYLPAPITLAAALAGVTQAIQLRLSVIVLPLLEPLHVAESLAVLDHISEGRIVPAFGAGYLADEFRMFDRDFNDRLTLLDEGIAALAVAWTGEPFDYRGRRVRVTPRPYGDRSIPIVLGGNSLRAARHAARVGDGFDTTAVRLREAYSDECNRIRRPVGWLPPTGPGVRFVHVAEDPVEAWQALGPHLLHENNWYAEQTRRAGVNLGFEHADTVAVLRERGTYHVMTPEDCVVMCRELPPNSELPLHPLVGGAPPELGWECLELVASRVLPALDDGDQTAGMGLT